MKKNVFLFFILISFLSFRSFCQAQIQKQNILSKQEKRDGWKLLFDGKTTKGWHKYGSKSIAPAWKVVNGELYLDTTVKDGGGDITTNEEFSNFDLKLEWKISPKGNSGIIFYVHEDTAYDWCWETGPEMQVLDNINASDNKKENHLAGALYDLLGKAERSKPKPVGEWNEAEIICINGKLDLYLNGENIVSTVLWDDYWRAMIAESKFKKMKGFGTYKKGRIALQDHGYAQWYRNIKIRKL